ncbi:MAG TPA: hypothetical protein VK543_07475 [Puia sp.]|nr:hypothetical protein [Puia sp.]
MKYVLLFVLGFYLYHSSFSQNRREDIYSAFVLYPQREALRQDLKERVIGHTFLLALDSNSENKYESACSSIAQFLLVGQDVELGFQKLFSSYDSLQYDTRRAFLEAVYAVYPQKYSSQIKSLLEKETNPKLFSMCAVYLYRIDPSVNQHNMLKRRIAEQFPCYDTVTVLNELSKYLTHVAVARKSRIPDIVQLFRHQKITGQKIIYSFQRWNRDYPGLAIVQLADGRFARKADGRLLVFQQLARSGADLPYFITDGSTPQGIFSIQGLDVAHNLFIGPTPNIQMIMPFEDSWEKYFLEHGNETHDSLRSYLHLLPEGWRHYQPMMEAWFAGKTGRTEIIAHGTAIDPAYFRDKPYYPLTPTLGCLCAKEIWNNTTGHLLVSEQFGLVSAFKSSPGDQGYLYVINVDDQQKPVSRMEVDNWVKAFEKKK